MSNFDIENQDQQDTLISTSRDTGHEIDQEKVREFIRRSVDLKPSYELSLPDLYSTHLIMSGLCKEK